LGENSYTSTDQNIFNSASVQCTYPCMYVPTSLQSLFYNTEPIFFCRRKLPS
jgi:hypothetical protein